MPVSPNACAGEAAETLVCVEDYAQYARKVLPRDILDYYYNGSCEQTTLQINLEAFKRLRIRPRVLIDASQQVMKTRVLGKEIQVPLGVSPSALQQMAHPQGEIGIARAIGKHGGVYILSTLSSTSLEDVRKEAPDTTLWFQLYIYRDRELMRRTVQRAEKAGYEALVLTVDANIFGIRYADERNNFDMPSHVKLGNFVDEIKEKNLRLDNQKHGSTLRNYVETLFDPSISWKDISWLKSITKLPVILKGILTPEDAELAIQHGADAIVVSNHGGRQIDTSPAAIEALPEIAEAVAGKIDIYLDSGIRHGTDIFKALALGAKMVFIARPALWGLAHSGERGAKAVMDILIKEFKVTMGLAGCQDISDIKKSMVVHESYYSKF